MKKEDVKAQYLSFSESAEHFKDNHIDAFIVTAGIPNAAIMDISTQHEIRILNIPDDIVQKLTQKYPFLSAAKVPANTYKSLTAEVNTVAVNAVLIVSSEHQGRRGLQPDQGFVRKPGGAGLGSCQGEGTEPRKCGQGRFHPLPSRRREVL